MYAPVISSSDEGSTLFLDEDFQDMGDKDEESESNSDSADIIATHKPIQQRDLHTDSNVVEPSQTKKIIYDESTLTMEDGDTIASILTKHGLNKIDIHSATTELSKIFNLKSLRVGQEMSVKAHRDSDNFVLDSLEIKPNMKFKVVVSRNSSGKFKAEKIEVPIKKVMKTSSGTISLRNPLASLVECGVKLSVAKETLRTLGQMVNIKSSKGPVNFEVLYRDYYDNEGNVISKPDLVYAAALVNGSIFRVYNFKFKDASEYVDSNGIALNSMIKSRSMLGKPLNYMKITSGYGVRCHPVHGRNRRHTGIDLKAPSGTPIYATADGMVVQAGYYSGYGKYVRVRHSSSIDTAYGHMSRVAVRSGQRVRQGQVVGYVGATGITTGAHLHYEVMRNGVFINPLASIKQEPQKLTGEKFNKFNQFKKEVNLQIAGFSPFVNKKTSKIKKFS
jgi:murein DD-endopeptidase MepM/ murein hydrolase activator NlpD